MIISGMGNGREDETTRAGAEYTKKEADTLREDGNRTRNQKLFIKVVKHVLL